jgi:dihydrofolate synthase/folylpolyglutamate synthase
VALSPALERLYARIPMGMRLGLGPMRDACVRSGHPERAFAAVHVAGTNGKGSVCAMVEAIARAAGMRTGLYTSPHLCRFAERIRVDGEPIADEALARSLAHVLDAEPELSFFEVATLTAFQAFREAALDLAIVEVGLGGRLDATNVLPLPRAAAITRIALDHVDRLGPTRVAIGREKAGIAKPGLDVVLGPMPADVRAAIDEVARAHGATTTGVDDAGVRVPPIRAVGLAGDHQRDNARVAALLGARIGASFEAIDRGIAGTRWPARLERVGRHLLDAAHNPDGAASLARYVRALGVPAERTALVFGALADKDWETTLGVLAPLARTHVYLEPGRGGRAAVPPADMLAVHPGSVASSAAEALRLAEGADLVIVAGSIGLVGEVRARLLSLPCDPPVAL